MFGLAAQQTLGNLIAGMVLISARPFKVGDRVRLQAGGLAGQIEGVVASLGAPVHHFAQGEDSIMVPNNVVLTAAVVPLREPAAVDLRARLRPDVKPERPAGAARGRGRDDAGAGEPHIALEEVDRDEVIVRIAATPVAEATVPGSPTRSWPQSAPSRAILKTLMTTRTTRLRSTRNRRTTLAAAPR